MSQEEGSSSCATQASCRIGVCTVRAAEAGWFRPVSADVVETS